MRSVLVVFATAVLFFALGFFLGRGFPAVDRGDFGYVGGLVGRKEGGAAGSLGLSMPSGASVTSQLAESADRANAARLQAFMDLNSRFQTKYQLSMLSGESLNDDFVTLFGLNEGEAQRLRDTLATAKTRLAKAEASRAIVSRMTEGRIKISIPPFADEGGRIYDDFMQSLKQVLGTERFNYYASNPASDVERSPAFGMFGLNSTSIEIRSVQSAPNVASNWHFDEKGEMSTDVLTNPSALKSQYPELYKRLVAEGVITPASSD